MIQTIKMYRVDDTLDNADKKRTKKIKYVKQTI